MQIIPQSTQNNYFKSKNKLRQNRHHFKCGAECGRRKAIRQMWGECKKRETRQMWECKKIIQTHHFKCGAVSARRVLDIADKSTIRKFQMLQNDGIGKF